MSRAHHRFVGAAGWIDWDWLGALRALVRRRARLAQLPKDRGRHPWRYGLEETPKGFRVVMRHPDRSWAAPSAPPAG